MSAQLNWLPYDQHRFSFGPSAYVPLLSDQTRECLAYFQRWLTPADQEASRRCAELRRVAADFGAFQRMAAADAGLRTALQRRFNAFEEAGKLILSGTMRADLFFDAWHDVAQAWRDARPYVLGMRVEAADPRLYAHFEWLAQRADEYREETRRVPPKWRPISYPEPTAADKAVFDSFSDCSMPGASDAGWLLFTMLQRHGGSADGFERLVPPDSDAELAFERFMDAYSRAGALVRQGILHPTLFFTTWRSPIEILTAAEAGIEVMKARRGTTSLWQSVAWLANFELEWHKRIVSLAQEPAAYRVSAG